MKIIHISITEKTALRLYGILLIIGSLLLFSYFAHATTPNPGHPWTDLGDGNWQVANTQTGIRTFTFPDSNGTVLTTAGAPLSGTVPYGNGTGVLATTSAGTNGFVLALVSGVPTWQATSTLATISGLLGLTTGGTNAALTASNGGIVYSNASALAILSGTATAGQMLQSGSTAAPTWSTATYPATAGTSGNSLISDGTNFTSTAPATVKTVSSRPALATGAISGVATASLTSFDVGLFTVPTQITVNQLSYNIGAVTTAGTYKVCVYTEDGATKKIDVTSGTNGTSVNNVSVGAIVLAPGNYYVAMGCATTCSNTVSHWTSTSQNGFNIAVPASKEVYEGTVTMTSGTCNSTITTTSAGITATNSKTPVIRFDN